MITWAFTLCYQEAVLIPYWVRHYKTFCDKVIVYVDVDSTDNTAEIAADEGATVRPYQGWNGLDDIAFIDFAQKKYKEARGQADWVIWTDADEFLYAPYIDSRLRMLRMEEVLVPRTQGYSMFSDQPPSGSGQIYDEIKRGIESPAYNKICIFNPMLDVLWTTGKHQANISGDPFDDGAEPLKLLHYRWLGEDWHLARNARNYARLNAENIQRQHGAEIYPGADGLYSPRWYVEQSKLATEII